MPFVYKITNPSGRIYIGCTTDFEKRMRRYKRDGARGQHALRNSIKKYGFVNHDTKILLVVRTMDEAFEWEKELIMEYNSIKTGLNIHAGGKGGDTWGHSSKREEIIQKHFKSRLGSKNPNFGNHFKHSKESIALMRKNKKSANGSNNPGAIAIQCKKYGLLFGTIQEAARHFGVSEAVLSYSLQKHKMTLMHNHTLYEFEYTFPHRFIGFKKSKKNKV